MAISAGTLWELRTTGSDNSGGGFNPTNANFPTDLAATDGNTASPVVTSASYTFVAGDVGAWIFIQSGTNWTPGWYQIASVAGGAATLTASVGSAVLYVANSRRYAANTAAGCATVASPTGGVFGVDYSQQAAAAISFTDMVIGGTTTTFTSAGNPVGKNFVGNLINVTGGTGFTVQFVEVVSTSGTTATCDKSLGTGGSTGGTGGLGGALLTWTKVMGASSPAVAGNGIWVQSGTYTVTAAIVLNAGGTIAAGEIWTWGYDSRRGDDGTRPVLTSSTSSVNLINLNAKAYRHWKNLKFTHTGATRGRGIYALSTGGADDNTIENCVFDGLLEGVSGAFTAGWSTPKLRIEECTFINCTGDAVQLGNSLSCTINNCYFGDNTLSGIKITAANGSYFIRECRFDTNGAYGIGVGNFVTQMTVEHCSFYANASGGFNSAITTSTSHHFHISDNIFEGGPFGVSMQNALSICTVNRCNAYYNHSTAPRVNFPVGDDDVTLTGSPFTDAANGDFTLNNTAGAGAACRGTASPAYLDIGALQHQDSGTTITNVVASVRNMFVTEEVSY